MNNNLVTVDNKGLVLTEDGIKFIKKFQKAKVQLQMMEDELKEIFLNAMETNGIEKYSSPDGTFKVNYSKETTTTRLDSKKLKEELPDIYKAYTVESLRKAYVRFN